MQAVLPEEVGVSSSRLHRLDATMQRYVDDGKLAGVVILLSRRGQVFHVGCYGTADREHGRLMQTDTIFRLWSITKAFTATAVLMLYEQGYFALDQGIADFIPVFRDTKVFASEGKLVDKERPITIRQLLSHSTGMASISGQPRTLPEQEMANLFQSIRPDTELADVVERMACVPLAFQPNTVWHYGPSFEVAARLVEIISGKSFAAFLQEDLLGPLCLVDTGYSINQSQLDRFSTFYTTAEDGSLKIIETSERNIHYVPAGRIPDHFWTPGSFGLVSTPVDLLRFAHMLFNRGELDGVRILAPRTVDLMASNHLPPALLPYRFAGGEPFYGYGHGLGVHVLLDPGLAGVPCARGEFWKDGGSGTLFWVDPHSELVGIVLYQLDPFWIHPIFAQVKALAYQAVIE
jgi:CubicO group peptidase (beta-lactamase class C family)